MKKLLIWGYSVVLIGTMLACESRPDTETTDANDTVADDRRRVSDELREFEDWVSNKANRIDSSAEENWPEVKEEFKQRSARIESRMDSLSAESREEYARIKAEYQAWEEKQERRASKPLDANELRQWEQELLGPTKELATLTAADMRETYLLFMGIVRAKKQKWTQDDWDYVDNVYSRLNARREELEGAIPVADRLKIKTLQAEYLALEASHDAKDLYQHVRK